MTFHSLSLSRFATLISGLVKTSSMGIKYVPASLISIIVVSTVAVYHIVSAAVIAAYMCFKYKRETTRFDYLYFIFRLIL